MKIKPSELKIIKLTDQGKKNFGIVDSGQIFDQGNGFYPSGLFSVEIFGPVGSEERNELFGLIDLKLDMIHPVVYKNLADLGGKYIAILEGRERAIFDPKEKDFVISKDLESETGFQFFRKHIANVVFKRTASDKRNYAIQLVTDALRDGEFFIDSLLVLPAGLRDYTVGKDGKPEEDEINTYYRSIISATSLIDKIRAKKFPELFDSSSTGIQRNIMALYTYVLTLIDGKHKLLEGNWVSRKIFDTTSNVLSSYVDKSKGFNDPKSMKLDDVRLGLFQYARTANPKSVYEIRNKYIRDIFPEGSNQVYLTNARTLKKELVSVNSIQKDMDLWTSPDGIEKVIASLGNTDLLSDPITFTVGTGSKAHNYYMGLLYRDNKHFKFIQDKDDVPEGKKGTVTPVTIFEFVYMSIYHMSGQYPIYVTRYPITREGSIYPAWGVIMTTNESETLKELDYDWNEQDDPDTVAINFPVTGSSYMRTMVVSPSKLGVLGADKRIVI